MIKTFSSGSKPSTQAAAPPDEGKSQLDVLDEELEAEMGELASDLEAQTPTMGDESRRNPRRIVSPGMVNGQSLAAELGMANEDDKPDEKVRLENKELKEEIKALQLYCSKVRDDGCRAP
jgi:hypothetical protein